MHDDTAPISKSHTAFGGILLRHVNVSIANIRHQGVLTDIAFVVTYQVNQVHHHKPCHNTHAFFAVLETCSAADLVVNLQKQDRQHQSNV